MSQRYDCIKMPKPQAKPGCVIHLNWGEVRNHASYKITRTSKNFNNRGTKMILPSALLSNLTKMFCGYCKISESSFSCRKPLVVASGLESNISNANLNKNKKKLFLYLHNSLANQRNTTKKIWFFSYIVNVNEKLKKTDEKTLFQAHIIEIHMLIKYRQLWSKNL